MPFFYFTCLAISTTTWGRSTITAGLLVKLPEFHHQPLSLRSGMKKVAFYTLGCKLNYSETSTISRFFEQKGYQKVDFHEKPDIFIINTCSVTENADKKCHKIVREARG